MAIDLSKDVNFSLAKEYKCLNLEITSYAKDRNGKEFIGTVEDKRHNICMSIFHPEEIPYNFQMSNEPEIYHEDSVKIGEKLAKGFVNLCKLNDHKFNSLEEMRSFGLVENLNRTKLEMYSPMPGDYFYEIVRYNKGK